MVYHVSLQIIWLGNKLSFLPRVAMVMSRTRWVSGGGEGATSLTSGRGEIPSGFQERREMATLAFPSLGRTNASKLWRETISGDLLKMILSSSVPPTHSRFSNEKGFWIWELCRLLFLSSACLEFHITSSVFQYPLSVLVIGILEMSDTRREQQLLALHLLQLETDKTQLKLQMLQEEAGGVPGGDVFTLLGENEKT